MRPPSPPPSNFQTSPRTGIRYFAFFKKQNKTYLFALHTFHIFISKSTSCLTTAFYEYSVSEFAPVFPFWYFELSPFSFPFWPTEGAAFWTQLKELRDFFRTEVNTKKWKLKNRIRSLEGAQNSTQVGAPVPNCYLFVFFCKLIGIYWNNAKVGIYFLGQEKIAHTQALKEKSLFPISKSREGIPAAQVDVSEVTVENGPSENGNRSDTSCNKKYITNTKTILLFFTQSSARSLARCRRWSPWSLALVDQPPSWWSPRGGRTRPRSNWSCL